MVNHTDGGWQSISWRLAMSSQPGQIRSLHRAATSCWRISAEVALAQGLSLLLASRKSGRVSWQINNICTASRSKYWWAIKSRKPMAPFQSM